MKKKAPCLYQKNKIVIVLVQIFFHTCLKKTQSPQEMERRRRKGWKKTNKRKAASKCHHCIMKNYESKEKNRDTWEEKVRRRNKTNCLVGNLTHTKLTLSFVSMARPSYCRNKRGGSMNQYCLEIEEKKELITLILLLIFIQRSLGIVFVEKKQLPVYILLLIFIQWTKVLKNQLKMCLPSSPKPRKNPSPIKTKKRKQETPFGKKNFLRERWKRMKKSVVFWRLTRKLFVLLFVTNSWKKKKNDLIRPGWSLNNCYIFSQLSFVIMDTTKFWGIKLAVPNTSKY